MTSTGGWSSSTPTKRWWRRRGEIHAVAAGSIEFEFAHLLDPIRSTVTIADSDDRDAAAAGVVVELARADATDEPSSSSGGHDMTDLPGDVEPWIEVELAWAAEVPSPSAEPWPFADEALTVIPDDQPWPSADDALIDVDAAGSAPFTSRGDHAFADEIDALLAGPVRTSPVPQPEEAEPDVEPSADVLVTTVAVSRFATAGVDDDRLPIISGRRARRSPRQKTSS